MLGKLIKYEFKSMGRIFMPFYFGILALSLITGIFGVQNMIERNQPPSLFNSLLITLLPTMLVISFVALTIFTFIAIVKRFDSNLLSDEGYLMFTLPVKTSQLIHSKLIAGLVWSLMTGVIFCFSMLLIFFNHLNELPFREMWQEFSTLSNVFPITFASILLILVSIVNLPLMVYASLAIAQAYSFTKNRIMGGVIVFVIISIIFNVVESIIGVSFMTLVFASDSMQQWMERLFNNDPGKGVLLVVCFAVIYTTIKNLLFYFLTKYHLENRLNLE